MNKTTKKRSSQVARRFFLQDQITSALGYLPKGLRKPAGAVASIGLIGPAIAQSTGEAAKELLSALRDTMYKNPETYTQRDLAKTLSLAGLGLVGGVGPRALRATKGRTAKSLLPEDRPLSGESLASSFNKQHSGHALKFDGKYPDFKLYQFTPQSGSLKGVTFTTKELSKEAIEAGYQRKLKEFGI